MITIGQRIEELRTQRGMSREQAQVEAFYANTGT